MAAIGKSKVLFNWTVIKRTFNFGIILTSLLIWGFDGLLWGIVFSAVTITVCNMYLVARYIGYGLWKQVMDLMPIILMGTIPFILFFCISTSGTVGTATHPMIEKSIIGVAYLTIYILIMILAPLKAMEDVKLEITSRFHKHRRNIG